MQHIKVTRWALCCLSVSRKLNILPAGSRVSSRQADAMRTRGWRGSEALPSSCLPARWSASGAAATRSLIRQPKRVLSGFPGLLSLFWLWRGPSSSAQHEKIRGKNERAAWGKCLRLQIRMKPRWRGCYFRAMLSYFTMTGYVPFIIIIFIFFRKAEESWRTNVAGCQCFLPCTAVETHHCIVYISRKSRKPSRGKNGQQGF